MNTVIYYPYLNPTPDWLKLAALCWDKVVILQTDDAPVDPTTVELDQALGGILDRSTFYRNIASDWEVCVQFESWVSARKEKLKDAGLSSHNRPVMGLFPGKFPGGAIPEFLHKLGLATLESRDIEVQIAKWEEEEFESRYSETENMSALPLPGSDHEQYDRLKRQARIESSPERARALEEQAASIRAANLITVQDTATTVYMPKDIALYYLSLCASKAAAELNSDLAAAGEDFTDIVFHDFRTLRGEIATSVLEAYLPKDFFSLDPQRIADYRIEFATQRLKYEKEIQSIVREFGEVASEGQLGKIKDRIVDLARERVEETKKTYQRAKLESIIKTFSVTIAPPAIIASVASSLGIGLFTPSSIAATLSLLAATKLLEWDKARSDRNKSPWSYVLDSAKMLH
jgi:hypothetical protein